MTNNEKAAIAAGLWKPNNYEGSPEGFTHSMAPDMHDPANLWRALEKASITEINGDGDEEYWVELYGGHTLKQPDGGLKANIAKAHAMRLADAVFAALVALYDAEHTS